MIKQGPLFSNIKTSDSLYDEADKASYKGVTLKTLFLLVIAAIVGAITYLYLPQIIISGNYASFYVALVVSSIVGFISVIVGRMSPTKSKYFGTLYAVCEGLFLGSLTCIVSVYVPDIAATAIFSTFIIFAVMLTLFGTGILRVSNTFRKLCYAFTIGAIALVLFSTIMTFAVGGFATGNIWILLGIELFLLIYGIITLALNFQEAQNVVKFGATKDAEWQVALGLTVSLVYIYVELVRLILIFSSRD